MFSYSDNFKDGMRAALPVTPTVFFIFMGFGMSAALAGMPGPAAVAMTMFVYAAPAQYAMLDMAASSPAGVWRLALVGILSNLRFFVMGLWFAQAFKGVSTRALV
ncbi:MAG: AzlC family ABC transporter permease, partial [Nitrospinota bacterium]|nr:AzlC family ABC transporter permease [Nitrospinota bacterium]